VPGNEANQPLGIGGTAHNREVRITDARRLAKEQADLAMAWLHKAVAVGLNNAEHVKQDKDLGALREREDFKKLLAELEAKQKESRVKNQDSEKKR
jgi:hypothetical protein